jgi:drug/metabolite transporter superfamily protein YnfA
MDRWTGGLWRFFFAFVILFLAGFLALVIRAIFHSQNNRTTGITVFVAVVGLIVVLERAFPSVYSRRRPTQWWQTRGTAAVLFGVIISILSSRIATLWFGLVVASGVLVALLLHVTRRDDEL